MAIIWVLKLTLGAIAAAIAPRVSLSTQIIANGNNWLATVTGSTNDYFELGNWKFEIGREFQEDETISGSRVAIIGKTVQKNLFGEDSPIDEVIRINKVPFTVIGLLEAKGGTAWADLDDTIIVPLKTAKQRLVAKKFPGDQIRSMTINVSSSDLLFKTEADIDTVMRKLHKISANGNPDFVIRNYAQFLNARQESSRVMSILLATVAGISLIVGGIGIMNIMLVTVTERTKEIGVCMSVGAPTDIQTPISLVRSVTVTNIMFIIPIPPTISDMPATVAKRIDITLDDSCLAFRNWA